MRFIIHRFTNKILIIDKSNDPVSRAKLLYVFKESKLFNSIFDLKSAIPAKNCFINPLLHHSGLKILTNKLIPKPRKAETVVLKRLDLIRNNLYQLFKLISKINGAITPLIVFNYLASDQKLLNLSELSLAKRTITTELGFLKDDDSRQFCLSIFVNLVSSPLFSETTLGNIPKKEIDLSLMIHCDISIFLYTPSINEEGHDRLLSNHLKHALRHDIKNVNIATQKRISLICAKIKKLSEKAEENIIPNIKPLPSNIGLLLAS
jgi:hypothetical protein